MRNYKLGPKQHYTFKFVLIALLITQIMSVLRMPCYWNRELFKETSC